MRSRFPRLAALFITVLAPCSAIGQIDSTSLPAVTDAVKQMCLHPDRKGSFLRVEGEVEAGVILKIVGAELSGTITRESWEGISQRLDQYKSDPRTCAVQVLQILMNNFRTSEIQEKFNTEHAKTTLEFVISEFSSGKVRKDRFSNNLNYEINRQKEFIFPEIRESGSLEDVRFFESIRDESGKRIDQFIAYHTKGSFLWTISFSDKGIIDVLFVKPIQ